MLPYKPTAKKQFLFGKWLPDEQMCLKSVGFWWYIASLYPTPKTMENFTQTAVAKFKSLYLTNDNFKKTVSVETQNRELENLKSLVRFDHCYFTVSMTTNGIYLKNAHGLELLGYDNATFSFPNYLSIMSESYQQILLSMSQAIMKMANNYYNLAFCQQQFKSDLPLKSRSGEWHLVQRTVMPYQIEINEATGEKRITEYLNLFKILRIIPESQVSDINLNLQLKDGISIKKDHEERLLAINRGFTNIPLSQSERVVLRKLTYSEPTATYEKIANEMGLKRTSIETFVMRGKEKIAKATGREFHNIQSLCSYLRGAGLI